jgi:hypothetical protein
MEAENKLRRAQAASGRPWNGANILGSVLQRVRDGISRWKSCCDRTGKQGRPVRKWIRVKREDIKAATSPQAEIEKPMRWDSANQTEFVTHLKGQGSARMKSAHHSPVGNSDGWDITQDVIRI